MRFGGQEPTLADGFRAAYSRLPQIAAWALVSATVGMLLKAVEHAHERGGQLISGLLGTAWTVITYFVVPVLVVEKLGPFEAIKRSLQLLKQTWGDALLGKVGLGLFKMLLAIPAVLLVFLAAALCTSKLVAVGVAFVILAVLYSMALATVSAALDAIFLGALYQYAAHQRVPDGFDAASFARAFGKK
jgi:hypothetical protein